MAETIVFSFFPLQISSCCFHSLRFQAYSLKISLALPSLSLMSNWKSDVQWLNYWSYFILENFVRVMRQLLSRVLVQILHTQT